MSLTREMGEMVERGYTFRPTTDDWAPNWPGDLVGIVIFPMAHQETRRKFQSKRIQLSFDNADYFRVAVWGADDLGMEKEMPTLDEARQLVLSLPSIITMADLKSRGFQWA